jgi:hypothetical protein
MDGGCGEFSPAGLAVLARSGAGSGLAQGESGWWLPLKNREAVGVASLFVILYGVTGASLEAMMWWFDSPEGRVEITQLIAYLSRASTHLYPF